jgi:heme-degrading monooxygenase HmoA
MMSIYSIWDTHYPAQVAAEGLQVTQAIWADMPPFDGYLDHEIVQDLEDDGHIIVISRWRNQQAADDAMSYASNPNARRADRLVSEPRRRTLGLAR